MIDLVAYRISIGTFSNSHAGKEARLAEMFPNVKHKIITMLPILLLAISALHIRDDAGVESNPGPTKTFDCDLIPCYLYGVEWSTERLGSIIQIYYHLYRDDGDCLTEIRRNG